jgi:putative hydrolase of the HAD superfamily
MNEELFATVRCVVFDIDDTLYLERDYVRSGFAAIDRVVSERFGAGGFAIQAWELFEQGIRGNTFDLALRACGVEASPADIESLVTAYRQHLPAISLAADAAACLAAIEGKVAIAAISDGPFDSQHNKALALGLARWCEPVVLTATLGEGKGKPHPAAFQRVEQATGFRGDQCLYLADNPAKDFQGPRGLGWRTIRIRRPLGLHFDVDAPAIWDVEMADLGKVAGLLMLASGS